MKLLIVSFVLFIMAIFAIGCGSSKLIKAASNGNEAEVQVLLENGADVNEVYEEEGWKSMTALSEASRAGYFSIVKTLLQNGADPNLAWPLTKAASEGHWHIAKLLIDNGADPNYERPLYQAAFKGHWDIVKLLIENGAVPKVSEDALLRAIEDDQRDFANLFIESGAKADYSVFIALLQKEDFDVVELLINKGANIDLQADAICLRGSTFFRCEEGLSALMFAIINKNMKMIKFLLDHGADPYLNIVIEDAEPVGISKELFREQVKWADVTFKGFYNIKEQRTTPIEYARKNGLEEIINIIECQK